MVGISDRQLICRILSDSVKGFHPSSYIVRGPNKSSPKLENLDERTNNWVWSREFSGENHAATEGHIVAIPFGPARSFCPPLQNAIGQGLTLFKASQVIEKVVHLAQLFSNVAAPSVRSDIAVWRFPQRMIRW